MTNENENEGNAKLDQLESGQKTLSFDFSDFAVENLKEI
jgi:hypothetical protein